MAMWCEGGFKRDKGVSRRAVNVLWQAWQRKVWIREAGPWVPSPTRAWIRASVIPEYWHCWLGQAKPSVFIRLGAPRRLFTSLQGRTGVEAGLTPEEERRQMGQSSGVRGLRRRCTEVRTAAPFEWEG